MFPFREHGQNSLARPELSTWITVAVDSESAQTLWDIDISLTAAVDSTVLKRFWFYYF